MRRIKVVALMLAIVMLLAGCSLVSPDEERIAMQVIATVNGTQIYNYEVSEDDVEYFVQQNLSTYGMSESDLTPEDLQEMYDGQREFLLEMLVNDKVMLQKAAELGLTLTGEEKAEKMIDAQEYIDSIINNYIFQIEAENAEAAQQAGEEVTEATEEDAVTSPQVLAEAEIRAQALMDENRITLESHYEYLCAQTLILRVRKYATELAQVSGADVQTWYDQTLAIQREEMDAVAGSFEELVYSNKIYTYVPERIVAVRDVLLAFDEEPSTLAKDMYNNENMDGYNSFIDELAVRDSDSIATADDIKSRLEAGESMEDIIAELAEDMPNISEPNSDLGYLVNPRAEGFSQDFVDAALGLQNIGEIAEPVADYKGVHVLQLIEVYEPGVVAFDDLKESIRTALQPGAEQDMYEQMLETWVEEADIKYFYSRMG